MKLNRLFSTVALSCLLAVGIPTQADAATYTVILTSTGPNSTYLSVRAGDVIGFTGRSNGSFYGGIVTSAPAGSKVKVGGNDQWLAGCLDFGFIVDVAGTYTFTVSYDGATYSGTVIAAANRTFGVSFGSTGVSPTSLMVKAGDEVSFSCGTSDIWEYTGIHWTSDPTGYLNSITDAGLLCETTPVTISLPGTYSYVLRNGISTYNGTIIATESASSSVQTSTQIPGLSMRVSSAPNNGAATVTFTSDRPRDLQLALFDATGKQVRAYEDVKLVAGEYSLPLSSNTLPSGDYFLRAISAGAVVATAKVLIVH